MHCSYFFCQTPVNCRRARSLDWTTTIKRVSAISTIASSTSLKSIKLLCDQANKCATKHSSAHIVVLITNWRLHFKQVWNYLWSFAIMRTKTTSRKNEVSSQRVSSTIPSNELTEVLFGWKCNQCGQIGTDTFNPKQHPNRACLDYLKTKVGEDQPSYMQLRQRYCVPPPSDVPSPSPMIIINVTKD